MLNLEKEQIASELRGSLLAFTRFFFPILTGREYIVSRPDGRESHHVVICRALTRAARLEIPSHRLLLNTPPGSGKSLLMIMFVAWTMAQHPDSKYIFVSYSKTLSDKQTEIIKRIMQLKEYEYLFDVKIRKDSKAKDYFQTEQGGAVASAGSSGSITGISAAEPGLDRFSGALICFPHDELIHTEKGMMKIGDIVDNKLDVRVYSFNLKTREVELKEIERYFENPGSELVEIEFEDGSTLRCTPDHKVWTDNRGWIEAQYLLCSDQLLSPSPNSSLRKSNYFSTFSLSNIKIFQNFHLIFRKLGKFGNIFSFSKFFSFFNCFGFSNSTSSNFMNCKWMNFIDFCNFFVINIAGCNMSNLFCGQLTTGMYFSSRESSMNHRVSNIFRTSSITQILNSIIKSISVYMPNINISSLRANECPGHKSMNTHVHIETSNSGKVMSFRAGKGKFLNLLWLYAISPVISIFNFSFFRSNSSNARNTVTTISTRNVSPLFVREIAHVDKTYCLTVKDNHNMFMGTLEDKLKLVSNCDDLHKPDEVFSSSVRQGVIDNFSQTLQQRLRSVKAPIIMIGQRLHEADISAHVISGKDGYEWEQIVLKSIDEAGNIMYPEVYSREMLFKRQETDPYVFASQYQQDPIPAGGALFKPEWFVLLDEEPEMIVTFVVCDTAETAKTYNDASAFGFFGLYEIEYEGKKTGQHAIHCINAVELRVEPKDLKDEFLQFWSSCMRYDKTPSFAAIEKKSTGVTLLSVLQEMRSIRVIDIPRSSSSGSKTKRFLDSQPLIAERRVSFPAHSKHTSWCIEHMSKITANDSHAHDDFCFVAGTKIATLFGDKNIEDIKVGDCVITPFGFAKVSAASSTGFHQVIRKFGLEGTGNHPVFSQSAFTRLDVLSDDSILSKLSLSELMAWKLKRLLFLKELRTDSWGRGAIISLSTSQQKTKSALRACMSQFGNLITNLKFLSALLFIISTATVTITTLIIWLAYLVSNIISNTLRKDVLEDSQKSVEKALKKPAKQRKRGIARKRVGSGTEITQRMHSINCEQSHALSAQQHLNAEVKKEPIAQESVSINTGHKEQERNEQDLRIKEVFSLTVEKHGVYYANGILVSNCDVLADALRMGLVEKTTLSMYSNQQTSSNAAKLLSAEFNKISSLRKSAYTH